MKYTKSLFIFLLSLISLGLTANAAENSAHQTETVLIENNKLRCNVVCPKNACKETSDAASYICQALSDLSGKNCKIRSSSAGENAVEVIVGDGAYQKAAQEYLSYTYGSYIVKAVGKKIIVAAHDAPSLKNAARDLAKVFVTKMSDGRLVLTQDLLPSSPEPAVKGFIPPYICSLMPEYVLQCGAVKPEDTSMQVSYPNLSSKDFDSYCESLKRRGYELMCENTVKANRFASYSDGRYLVSVSYYGNSTKMLSIVSEPDYAKKIWTISGTKGTHQVLMMQVYQDNIKYRQSHPGGYIVRLSDGRFFIFDTGNGETAEQMMDYMRSRNVFTDGKVHIALIVISHPHPDHMNGLAELASKFKDEIVCEAVAYNMTNHTRQTHYALKNLKAKNNALYNNGKALGAECYCLRSGQKIDLAGASLEVLFTPDELGTYILTGKNEAGKKDTNRDQNNSSNIVRLTVEKQQITFTGDCRGGEAGIFNTLVKPSFTSDIMTVAHHGFNVSATLQMYEQAQPFVLFWNVRQDEQAITRHFDKVLMSAPYVKKHFFEETLVEIELPYSVN